MSELREIVKKVVPLADDHFVDNVIKLFMDWHKSERKKWALGLLPKRANPETEKEHELPNYCANIAGFNLAIAEIRKKIKEGK